MDPERNAVVQRCLAVLLFTGLLALTTVEWQILRSPTFLEAGNPRELRLHGRVLTPAGEPLPRVPVAYQGNPVLAIAETDDEGRFDFAPPAGAGRWSLVVAVAFDQPLATVRCAVRYEGEPQPEYLIVAAPKVAIAGRVVDEAGAALAGVTAEFLVRHGDLVQFPHAFDGFGYGDRPRESTNGEGRFELRVPATAGVLRCSGPGFRQFELEWDPARGDFPDVVMRAGGGRGECAIRGTVRFADGQPAAGALVRYGCNRATASADGSFCLAVRSGPVVGPALCAAVKGYQPVVRYGLGEAIEAGTLAPQELVLERLALSIQGRVVDEEGRALRRWAVELCDGTELTWRTMPILYAEHVAGSPRGFWGGEMDPVETRDHGYFVLDGLLERDYVIEAWDYDGMQMVRSDPVPAGTWDLVLVVQAAGRWPVVPGRVVGADGRGIAGVRVRASLDVHNSFHGHHNTIQERTAQTDRNGRFELREVPKNATIRCSSRTILGESFSLAWKPKDGDLAVTVSRPCRLRFTSGALQPVPDALEVLDAGGEPLPIQWFSYWQAKSVPRYDFDRGATPVLTVSEAARTLVLMREGEEVARRPLRLDPETVTVVRGAD